VEVLAITRPEALIPLLPLLIEEAQELGIDASRVSLKKCLRTLEICLQSGAVLAAYDKSGKAVGVMALLSQEVWWGQEVTICTAVFFVTKEARKSSAAVRLLNFAKTLAKGNNLELNIFLDTDTDLERKDKFFKRSGFTNRGGIYRLNKE
jgi:GNAT superfamily N-acetyltransferase